MIDPHAKIDSLAHVDPSATIGAGTCIWQFVVILANAIIGNDCNLNAHTLVEGGAVLGDRVTLKSGVFVWNGVELADDVFCGPNATFTNDRYPRSRLRVNPVPTYVGKGASIGAGAIILPGVTIGAGAMVGAGAVVTRDIGAGETVVGNPARPPSRRAIVRDE